MRLKLFKYFLAIPQHALGIMYRAPPLASYSNLVFLPFDTSVWIASAFLIILGGVLMRTIFLWEETEAYFAVQVQENEENYPKTLDIIMMQVRDL